MGCGGTIGFMEMLLNYYPEAQFCVTGLGGPHSNFHGPDETLDIETAKRLSGCVASVLLAHASQPFFTMAPVGIRVHDPVRERHRRTAAQLAANASATDGCGCVQFSSLPVQQQMSGMSLATQQQQKL